MSVAIGTEVSAAAATWIAQGPTNPTGAEFGKASPIGLVIILMLLIGVFWLVRSMNKQLGKLPSTYDPDHPEADQEVDDGTDRPAVLEAEAEEAAEAAREEAAEAVREGAEKTPDEPRS